MEKTVLVINSGSSSLKFSLFAIASQAQICSGLAQELSSEDARLDWDDAQGDHHLKIPKANHGEALAAVIDLLKNSISVNQICGVGHRVVHGGEYFNDSVLVNKDTLDKIERCNSLAPLHNPANVYGIKAIDDLYPALPQVAVFDTAFHHTLAKKAFLYALPYELYTSHGVRRYGFHGISHQYVANQAVNLLKLDPNNHAIVTAHLGNGCSLAAIKNGKSVDTTMGMTPLEGLVMGTRSGNIDPGIHEYLEQNLGWDIAEITHVLNKKSGLLGVSELSSDVRTLCEESSKGHKGATLAIDVFCYTLAKSIAAMVVAAGRLDVLVFTAGIGENSALIREKVLDQLSFLGLFVDKEKNTKPKGIGLITQDNSTKSIVIKTNEEWMIAQDTLRVIDSNP